MFCWIMCSQFSFSFTGDFHACLGAVYKWRQFSRFRYFGGSEGAMFVDSLRIFSGLETNMPVEDS